MIINKIKQLNIVKKVGKKTLVITTALLVLGLSYSAYASGILVFKNSDGGSLLNLNLSTDTYNEGTKTFSDSSGKSNNAVLSNAATFTSDRNNKENSALNFNGSSDYLLVDNVVVSNPSALTISAWFKKEVGGGSYECVLHQGADSSIGSTAYWLGLESDDYLNATIGARAGVGWGAGRTNVKATPGQWYHLLATWDGSVVKVYVNGQYNKQYNLSSYSGLSTPTRIGASNNGSTYQFRGSVQDVGIYNRSFTDEEVKDLYNFTQPKLMISSINSGLVGHWTLDGDDYDSATNKVTDKTPYGNHGTNIGATPTIDRNGKINGAMSFDGLSNRVSISYPNPIKQTSVVAWFKKSGSPAGGHHIITGGSYVEISIPEYGAIRTGINTVTQGRMVFNSGSGLTDGNWHQVAMTYDGVNLKSFIDGERTASNPVSGDLSGTATEIGRFQSDSYVANGSISDVRIYNRGLSEEEIKSLYNLYQPSVSGSSLQKGLVLDMPLTSDWTKSSTPGSEVMIDRTPFGNDMNNVQSIISSEGAFLDGSGNRYIISSKNILLDGSQTYSVWVKAADISGWLTGVLTTHNYTVPANLGINVVGNRFNISIGYSDGNREYDQKPSNFTIIPNEWVNVVLLYDILDNSVSFYVNGVFDKKWILSRPVKFVSDKVLLGTWSNNHLPYYKFKGEISHVKIYNRALDATEVMSLYDQGR